MKNILWLFPILLLCVSSATSQTQSVPADVVVKLGHQAQMTYVGNGDGTVATAAMFPSFVGAILEQDRSSSSAQSEYAAPHAASQIEDANSYMTKSPELCRAAPAKGSGDAEFALGWFYQQAKGVTKDDNQAAAYYLAAAKQGHAVAENNLGVLYESGHGVSKNLREAARWFRASAEQGNPTPQCNLASLLVLGHGVRRDYAEAAKWLRAAAEQNNSEGQLFLCFMYYRGYGVAVDFSAAASGHSELPIKETLEQRLNLAFFTNKAKEFLWIM